MAPLIWKNLPLNSTKSIQKNPAGIIKIGPLKRPNTEKIESYTICRGMNKKVSLYSVNIEDAEHLVFVKKLLKISSLYPTLLHTCSTFD